MVNLKTFQKIIIFSLNLLGGVLIGFSVFAVWTEPSATPPNNNVSAPINVGSSPQSKLGDFGIGGGAG